MWDETLSDGAYFPYLFLPHILGVANGPEEACTRQRTFEAEPSFLLTFPETLNDTPEIPKCPVPDKSSLVREKKKNLKIVWIFH